MRWYWEFCGRWWNEGREVVGVGKERESDVGSNISNSFIVRRFEMVHVAN